MIVSTRHTGLVVRDLNKSLVFYEEILGLTIWKRDRESGIYIEQVVGIPGVVLEWAKLRAPDGSMVELLQYHSHPEKGEIKNAAANTLGCSHIAFTVTDIEELYQVLCAKGYHCNSVPQQSPDGLVKILYCHDPDGIILELVEEIRSILI